MKQYLSLLPLIAIAITITTSAHGQQPPPPSPIKITGIDVQKAKLPNSKSEWTKIICNFTNTVGWTDGVSFNYSVLVQPAGGGGEKFRVLSGGCTYMNVPKGPGKAIMYLSPNATTRFGTPVAATIEIFRGDRSLESFSWSSHSTSVDTNWATKYPPYQGMLLNMFSTPWIFSDGDQTADLLVN